MGYTMYLGDMAVPIMPEEIKIKITGQNKTLTLIDGTEINILKEPGLTDISFNLLLPNVTYPFAKNVEKAQYYLEKLEKLKTEKKSFQWIVSREMPNGTGLFSNDMTVALEDYQIVDSVDDGFDITVSVSLRQWKTYGTKTVTLSTDSEGETTATVDSEPRETENAPAESTYTVESGDCLWNIAKKYLGDGSRYTEIYELNKDKITNPNLIYPGQELTLPTS